MKLYLHIGSHKAGSTSIQSFIEDNQTLLSKAGFCIEPTLTYKDQWQIAAWAGYPKNADYFVNTMKAFDDKQLKHFVEQYPSELRNKLAAAKHDSTVHCCLISSEYLYSQCSNEHAIEQLATLFKSVFSSVTIVFYYRDQVSMARSVYAQLVDGPARSTISYDQFVETITEDSEFNYVAQLKKWAEYFGVESIRVAQIGSGQGCLQGEALLQHFISNLGLTDLPYHIPIKAANRSANYDALRLIRKLNSACSNSLFNLSNNNPGFRLIRKFIKSLPLGGQFPPQLNSTIAKRFEKPNQEMSEIFGVDKKQ